VKRKLSTLEYVNLGRAKRGVPPLDKLPSFYDSPFDYPDATANSEEDEQQRKRQEEDVE
jgi:hypothetical protein